LRSSLLERSSRKTKDRGNSERDSALSVLVMISTGERSKRLFQDGLVQDDSLQFPGRISMMTDPATAIKREVFQLIDLQIETLRREGRPTDCDLDDCRTRSGEITRLYREIDRIGRDRIPPIPRLARAS
jgi:hypothetical protein